MTLLGLLQLQYTSIGYLFGTSVATVEPIWGYSSYYSRVDPVAVLGSSEGAYDGFLLFFLDFALFLT